MIYRNNLSFGYQDFLLITPKIDYYNFYHFGNMATTLRLCKNPLLLLLIY